MDPEMKSLLEENIKLSKENNALLLKIHGIQRWSQITRILYWFIIIGISLGSFYFLKPYLGNLLNVYTGGASGVTNTNDMLKNLSDQDKIQELLNSLNQK